MVLVAKTSMLQYAQKSLTHRASTSA